MRPYLLFLALILCFLPACNLPRHTPTASPTLAVSIPATLPARVIPTTAPSQPAPPTATPASGAARSLDFDPALYSAYTAQTGDTLAAVAAHFGAAPGQIRSAQPLPERGLLTPGQILVIPKSTEPP